MNKIEKFIFIILFVVSCVYSYKKPDEKIENIETKPQITIEVQGKIEKNLIYDHNPTIKEILSDLKIENSFGFDENYCLSSQEKLYIPEGKQLISLNTATAEQLMTIQGIGEKTALKIIQQREIESFKTIEDIMNVKGIGEKTYLKIREYLCL